MDLPERLWPPVFLDNFQYRGNERLPGAESLPSNWTVVSGAFSTADEKQLVCSSPGILMYSGTPLSSMFTNLTYPNFGWVVRLFGQEGLDFSLRVRENSETDEHISVRLRFTEDEVIFKNKTDAATNLYVGDYSLRTNSIDYYSVELWTLDASNYWVLINGNPVFPVSSAPYAAGHDSDYGFSLEVHEIPSSGGKFSKFAVHELLAYNDPVPNRDGSDLFRLFRELIKEEIENPSQRNWNSFVKARKLWQNHMNTGKPNVYWEDDGLPIREPLPEEFISNTTTTVTNDLQMIIDDLILNGENPVLVLSGNYVLEEPISFRGEANAMLLGDGYGTTVTANFSSANQNKPMFDFSGCTDSLIKDIHFVGGPQTNPNNISSPSCAILLARRPSGVISERNYINGCFFTGRYRAACVVNAGSENNTFFNCYFANNEGPSTTHNSMKLGGHNLLFCNEIPGGIVEADTGSGSLQSIRIDSCRFEKTTVHSRDGGGSNVHIISKAGSTVSGISFLQCNSKSNDQFAWIILNQPGSSGTCQGIFFDRSFFDEDSTTYGIYAQNDDPREVQNISMKDCDWEIYQNLMYFGWQVGYLEIRNVYANKNTGASVAAAVVSDAFDVSYSFTNFEASGWTGSVL